MDNGLWCAAVHEAGHVTVAAALGCSVSGVAIWPDAQAADGWAGVTEWTCLNSRVVGRTIDMDAVNRDAGPHDEHLLECLTDEELLTFAKVTMAGNMGETMLSCHGGTDKDDESKVRSYLATLAHRNGRIVSDLDRESRNSITSIMANKRSTLESVAKAIAETPGRTKEMCSREDPTRKETTHEYRHLNGPSIEHLSRNSSQDQ